MDNLEYEILDELYFISSFEQLLEKLSIEEQQLVDQLSNMASKGWINVLEKGTDLYVDKLDFFHKNYKNYNYLASKKGLLAHNSR